MDERLREAPCGFISINHDGYITEVNQTFLEWMGYAKEELIGKHLEYLLPISNKLIFHSYFYPSINLYNHVEELFISLKNGSGVAIPFLMNARQYEKEEIKRIDCILVQMKKRIDYELELRSTKRKMEEAYLEKNAALAKLEQIYKEIEKEQTELMAMNSSLVEISYTDKLTGIKNRRFFQEKLEEHIHLFHYEEKPFSLLIIDIDYFKKVNDTYGHQVGDIVLMKLANILQNFVRPDDIVARFGGEEFTIILSNTSSSEAKQLAEQLNLVVEQGEWGEIGGLTISIGIATITEQDTETSIILNADQALYASKENGRNRATHFSALALHNK